MSYMTILFSFLISLLVPLATFALPAFPGAQGFGSDTPGGRGGEIVKVTNLNNSGPGSLRAALERSGKRIVVFAVEGRIYLTDQITVTDPYLTVAGQSAPGDGVVVTGARIQIRTHDVIVRGMKLRPGDDPKGDTPRERDALAIGNGSSNIIIDSNSMTWAIDETMSIWGLVNNVTISNNLIAEALYDSIHVDEGATEAAPHSTGMLIGGSNDSENITYARNMLVSNEFRNPMIKQGQRIEMINNFVSNYGAAHQGVMIGGTSAPVTANLIGNYHEDGKDTNRSESRPPYDFRYVSSTSKIYLQDNYQQYHNYNSFHGNSKAISGSKSFSGSNLKVLPSSQVKQHVMANMGARKFGKLDAVDARIVASVKDGTSKVIDYPEQVGGYGVYKFTGATERDSDNDGMPDWYEDQVGHNKNRNDANADSNGNGYSNIEDYLNGLLVGEFADQSGSGSSDSSSSDSGSSDSGSSDSGSSDSGSADSSDSSANVSYDSEVQIEAESMNLSGYSVQNTTAASGGAWIQTNNSGTASLTFDGDSGDFDIVLGYYDENDGEAEIELHVNGKLVESFIWDQDLGSAYANKSTLTERTFQTVALSAGDRVELRAQADGSEPARVDYLKFQRREQSVTAPAVELVTHRVEAEDLDNMQGFKLRSTSAASGKGWIEAIGSASAEYDFPGEAGTYDITIHYFDENDGVSTMKVEVNGQSQSFKWDKNLGSSLANGQTATEITLRGFKIGKGDIIKISGDGAKREPLRTDYLVISPAN